MAESCTVAVNVIGLPITVDDGAGEMVVVVDLVPTLSDDVPKLPVVCAESVVAYVPVIVTGEPAVVDGVNDTLHDDADEFIETRAQLVEL